MAANTQILGSFDLSRVSLTIGIIPITEGLVSAHVSKEGDEITPVDSNIGDITLNVSRKTRGQLSLTLNALAKGNIGLQEYAESVRAFGAPAFFPVLIADKASKVGIFTSGWIQHQPDATFADTVGDREWVIGLADASTSLIAAAVGAASIARSAV